MTERIPCREYDEPSNRCQSGFVRISSTCWGGNGGCPECMKEDGPAPHLMKDNGLPIGWPTEGEDHGE